MKFFILLTSLFFIQSFNSSAPVKKSIANRASEYPLYQFVPSIIITM